MRLGWIDRLLTHLLPYSYSLSQRLTLSLQAQVEGVPMSVPLLYGAGHDNLRVSDHDRPLAYVIERTLSYRPGAVIDVGCNIGHFLQLCVLVSRRRPYVGFDPSLSCCFYVDRFIRENRLPCHRVLPLGLSDRPGMLELRADGPFDVCASFSRAAHGPNRFAGGRPALVERGDYVLPRLGLEQIALVKIDVEGFELEVLQGLEETLAAQRPFLLVEVLQPARTGGDAEAAGHRRERAWALTRFFQHRDYVFFRLKSDGRLLPLRDLDPRDESDPREMDHLVLPREHEQAFIASVQAVPFRPKVVRAAA